MTARSDPDPSAEGPPTSTADRCVLPALLAAVFCLAAIQVMDFDVWWHLRTGRLILSEERVPRLGRYTYPDADAPWIDLHWGFQVLLAKAHRWGGMALVVFAKATCYALAAAVAWRAGGSTLAAREKGLLWLAPVVCLVERPYERPEMLTLVALALWFLACETAESRPRRLWLLPLVQLAWVNVHGLFVLGPVVGTAYLVDHALRRRFAGRFGLATHSGGPTRGTIVAVAACCLGAMLLNPYGIDGLLFPLELFRKMSVDHAFWTGKVAEFVSLPAMLRGLHRYGWTFGGAEIVAWSVAALGTLAAARARKSRPAHVGLLLAFGYLGLVGWRNINLVGVVSGVVACSAWGSVRSARLERTALPAISASGSPPAVGFAAGWGIVLAYGLLAAAAVSDTWGAWLGSARRFGFRELPGEAMHAAIRFAGLDGLPQRAFVAEFGQAGLFAYHHAPGRQTFVDGRLEVVRRATFERYLDALDRMAKGDPSWQDLVQDDAGSLPVVVLEKRNHLAQIVGVSLTPGWRMVYADSQGAVFCDVATAERVGLPERPPTALLDPPPIDTDL
jgi:hypothetical protein